MKKTLEEAALKHAKLEKIDSDERYYQTHKCEIHDAFIQGAKRQAERMYSEKEVGEMMYNIIGAYGNHYGIMLDGNMLDKLFEQFKKK